MLIELRLWKLGLINCVVGHTFCIQNQENIPFNLKYLVTFLKSKKNNEKFQNF